MVEINFRNSWYRFLIEAKGVFSQAHPDVYNELAIDKLIKTSATILKK